MNIIEIPNYLFGEQKMGVYASKMTDGDDNLIMCTYRTKAGILEYPKGIIINKQEAIKKYGLTKIQKNSKELGIFLPMRLFKEANS